MLFKWLPWDFVQNHPDFIQNGPAKLYGLRCFDPFIEKMILDKIPRSLFEEGKLHVKLGDELSVEWIQENLETIGLFGNSESYLILNGEMISSVVQKYISSGQIDLGERHVIISFSKESKFFDSMAMAENSVFYKIESPRFWEFGKLLDFLIEQMEMTVSYEVQNYILTSIPNTCDDFVACLNIIKLNKSESDAMSLEEVKKLISPSRLDQFLLASLFSQKKKAVFCKSLLEVDPNFEVLRSLFSFMQGHLYRLADVSYITQKKRPSKYDREIMAHSKLWTSSELKKEMRLFGKLEIEAKKRNPLIIEQIRSIYLSTF